MAEGLATWERLSVEAANVVEIVGYCASAMVALSLMMKDIQRLRWVNLLGCILFVAYGVAIDSWPVVSMNAFGACVNIFYLLRLRRQGRAAVINP